MAIRDWPADERPREQLLAQGSAALSDAELLAIFLCTGVAGKSAVDRARELTATFGSLRALLRAARAGFSAPQGSGPAKHANTGSERCRDRVCPYRLVLGVGV